MTPTGDYYTTVPLTVQTAQDLIDLRVRSVIVPLDAHSDEAAEVLLRDMGVKVRKVTSESPTEEICLTGS